MKINAKLYRELSLPHPTMEAAQEAVTRFSDAIEAARIECRIPNVVMIITANTIDADGDEITVGLDACFGNEAEWESMAGRLLGLLSARRQARIAKSVAPRGLRGIEESPCK